MCSLHSSTLLAFWHIDVYADQFFTFCVSLVFDCTKFRAPPWWSWLIGGSVIKLVSKFLWALSLTGPLTTSKCRIWDVHPTTTLIIAWTRGVAEKAQIALDRHPMCWKVPQADTHISSHKAIPLLGQTKLICCCSDFWAKNWPKKRNWVWLISLNKITLNKETKKLFKRRQCDPLWTGECLVLTVQTSKC